MSVVDPQEVLKELKAMRRQPEGLHVESLRQHAPHICRLPAVDDEISRGYVEDRPTAALRVVRCASSRLVSDFRSRTILLHTLVRPAGLNLGGRRAFVKEQLFIAESSESHYDRLEVRAYTDLATELVLAERSPCWEDPNYYHEVSKARQSLVEASESALALSALGAWFPDPIRRAAISVLEELMPEGMLLLEELVGEGRHTDPRILLCAVLEIYARAFDGVTTLSVDDMKLDFLGRPVQFVDAILLGADAFEPMQRIDATRFGLRYSPVRIQSIAALKFYLEREESQSWPSLRPGWDAPTRARS